MSIFSNLLKQKFKGYKHIYNTIDTSLPLKIKEQKNVAVIGGGIAGLATAAALGERGFAVTVYEKEKHLGGKIGAWPVKFEDGFQANVEHGFHAFFKQYYNLRNLMSKAGADKNLIPIDDYLIMMKDKQTFSFNRISKVPLANILSMTKTGLYSFADVIKNPKMSKLMALLQYDAEKTFEKFDHISFSDFIEKTSLPENMKIMFTTFSRAFFSEPQYMSMAELIKSFHFYFLSNDLGLIYDVLNDDFEYSVLNPIQKYLQKNNVVFQTGTEVKNLEIHNNSFLINDKKYDYLVIASDLKGTRKILSNIKSIEKNYPDFSRQMQQQKISQPYSVLRIWMDRDVPENLPYFIFTDAYKILDAVSLYHRFEKESADWANKNNGGVYELHSYALPDGLTDKTEIENMFLEEFYQYFPEMKSARILYKNLQIKDDFTAFHTGLYKNRPGVQTAVPNLYFAGDWVKIPTPAMLMEAASTSALFAANEILKSENLREEPVFTVPLKGILA